MATRKLNFPPTLIFAPGRRSYDALSDAAYVTAMSNRLNAAADTTTDNFTTRFAAKTIASSTDQANQNTQTGQARTPKRNQDTDFLEMGQSIASVRRSARLTFPDDPVELHNTFQFGANEPDTLNAELERAGIIAASCQQAENGIALKAQGWTAADPAALAVVGKNLAKDDVGDRLCLNNQKVIVAKAVHADALRIQNAARLQYPASKPGNETAAACFLLDEFPLCDRSRSCGGVQVAVAGASMGPVPSTT